MINFIRSGCIFRASLASKLPVSKISGSTYRNFALRSSLKSNKSGPSAASALLRRFSDHKGSLAVGAVGLSTLCGSLLYSISQYDNSPVSRAIRLRTRQAYAFFAAALGVACISAKTGLVLFSRFHPLTITLTCFAVTMAAFPIIRAMSFEQNPVSKIACFAAACAVFGVMFSPLLTLNPAIVQTAVISAATLFSGMSVVGMIAPANSFDGAVPYLNAGCIVVLAASLANIFAPPHVTIFTNIYAYLGLAVVSGITLHSTNELQRYASYSVYDSSPFDPINCALPLFVSFMNMVSMFTSLNGRKK